MRKSLALSNKPVLFVTHVFAKYFIHFFKDGD